MTPHDDLATLRVGSVLETGWVPCSECGKAHAHVVTSMRGTAVYTSSWANDDCAVYRPDFEQYARELEAQVAALTQERDELDAHLQALAQDHYFARAEAAEGRPVSGRRCRLGLHVWSEYGNTSWLREPLLSENEPGLAMEYRRCRRCSRVRDVTLFTSFADDDYGVPRTLGPLASQRFREILGRVAS